MSEIEPNWASLLIYLGCCAIVFSGGVYVSGSLPLRAAASNIRHGAGPLLIIMNVVMLTALSATSLFYAINEIRWTSLIIGTGVIALLAPFVVQDLPDALKDTQLGLLVLLVLASGATVSLLLSGGIGSLPMVSIPT
ncbi:MAG: hypothetical protein ACR2PA_14160 [Hyphomicrobiaceae bacterium]